MSNLKIKISVEKTDFDYDKCMLNNKHTKVTTVQVKSLQSLLFNTVLILFVKKGILGQNKICSHNFRIKNLINGGTVCIDVFKGDEVYDNHARTIYGKVWLKIQVDWKETLSSEKQSLQSGTPLHTLNTEEKQTHDVAHRPNNIDFAAKCDQDKFKAPNLQHLTALPIQYTKSADNLSTIEIFETPTQKFTPFDDYVSTERVLQILNDNHFTDQIEQNKDDIFNKMFTTLFDRQMAEKYSSSVPQLKRLFQYIAKGSFSCHLKFWTGLVVLESYYKQNGNMQFNFRAKTHNICNQEHHSTGELTERLEDNVYNAIAAYNKRVSRNHGFYAHYLNLYYYAIAPYGNSVMTYGIKNRAKHDTSTIEGSVLRFLNIDATDLSITNLPDKPDVQYIAFYDAQQDRLVISFRGTHNHIDAINDLDCEYQMFYEGYAHQGFVKIVNDFRHNHLDKIKKILIERKICKVLLTGQSLGGAICHIANIVIKREKLLEDIEVEVVAFQSPPAVSKEFIDQDNATNVIHGYDIFPRLSFGSLLDLKYLSISVVTMLNSFSRVNTSEFIRKVNNFLQRTDMNAKLYLPGKIYHVHSEDKVFYKSIDCEELMNIVVHIKNFWDHSFQSMIRALEKGEAERND